MDPHAEADTYKHILSISISRQRIFSVILKLDTGGGRYKGELLSKTFITREETMRFFYDISFIRSLPPQTAIEEFKNYSPY